MTQNVTETAEITNNKALVLFKAAELGRLEDDRFLKVCRLGGDKDGEERAIAVAARKE
jgi:hypothetical protein